MTTNERLETIQEKLRRLQALDTGQAIFGASTHHYWLNPPLPPAELEHFEIAHALSLPLEYRLFLTEIADGGAGPYYGLYSLAQGSEAADSNADDAPLDRKVLAIDFPLDTKATAKFIDNYNECLENGDDDEIVYPDAPDTLTGALFLAEYGCGWSYVLVVKGEQAGTVWFYGDYLYPVFEADAQWSFFDWYEDWLDSSLKQFDPPTQEEALGRDNTILSYDGRNLDQVPAEVFTNTRLKKLVLSRNNLTQFPMKILQLPELRTLDLSMTPIGEIPEAIAELGQLRKLRLKYNHLRRLPDSLVYLPWLEELSMEYSYELTEIPAVVGEITGLKRLSFTHSHALTSIPENIGNLAALESLALNDCPLTALPESVGRLQALKHLHLGGTQIQRLPKSFVHLTNLEFLDINIAGLDLTEAISLLTTLPQLHTLVLVNQLEFPSTLAELHTVKKLYIRQNYTLWHQGHKQLPLPENLTLFPNLEELDVTHNDQAASLPKNIGNLKHLKRLRVNATAISDFPDSLQDIPLELIAGSLRKGRATVGLFPQAKEKAARWFPQAKLRIY